MLPKDSDTRQSEPVKLTDTQDQSTLDTFLGSESGRMPQKSAVKNSQTLTCLLQDSLVSLSALLENGSDLKSQEARYFMRLSGLQNKKDLDYCYLKTLGDYYLTIKGKRLQSFSQRWMSSGMMLNGRCSIANISFHRTGKGYSLSDILEENPDQKYFLSKAMIRGIMEHDTKQYQKGNNFRINLREQLTQTITREGQQEQ